MQKTIGFLSWCPSIVPDVEIEFAPKDFRTKKIQICINKSKLKNEKNNNYTNNIIQVHNTHTKYVVLILNK